MSDPFNEDAAPQPAVVGDGWTVRAGMDSREQVAVKALRQAMDIEDELLGQKDGVGSQFRAYIKYAEGQAFTALVTLAREAPTDPVEILRLQKEIAPWNNVMHWITEAMEKGDQAVNEIDEEQRGANDFAEEARRIAQGEQ